MTVPEQLQRDDLDRPLAPKIDGWTHHVLDFDKGTGIRTAMHDEPLALTDRARLLQDVVGDRSRKTAETAAASRRLSATQPYQASPLSYLNAWGRSWSLWAEIDRLEWSEFGGEERVGALDVWFRDVVPGSAVLVSLEVTAGAKAQGVTGSYEIRSNAAPPRIIPVTGYRDETIDVVVRPDDPFAVLVTVRTGPGLGYFALRGCCYMPL